MTDMGQDKFHIDFEGRSLADLPKVGADMYAQHESTAPLMLAYGETPTDVECIDFFQTLGYPGLATPKCPARILKAIEDDRIFVAHNARFEQAIWYWICHKRWGWPIPRRWSCTAARSRYNGLRASLDGAASDLELLYQKDEFGKLFIAAFCKPREYRGAKKLDVIKTPWMEPRDTTPQPARLKGMLNDIVVPAEWYQRGIQYCIRDVQTEMEIDRHLPELPEFEQRIWELDFKMNMRGLPIDLVSVERAARFSAYYNAANIERFEAICSLRPTQRDRVLEYLNQRDEIENLGDLRSKTLKRIVLTDLPVDLQDMISIRLEASKASIKKLESMARCTSVDGNARGLFLYGGAHTMRWSGKRVQPQNYTRPDMSTLNAMFDFLNGPWWNAGMVGHNGGPPLDEMPQQPSWVFEAGMRFPRPLGALALSMRGFIAAPKGKRIVSGDYSQIEARVLVWLARCMGMLDAFRNKMDPYVLFGSQHLYKREYDDCFEIVGGKRKVKKDYSHPRQVSKSAVLGCGFGLGWRQFIEYCDNADIFITVEESKDAIKAYRSAHPEIADYEAGLWARVERCAKMAVANEGRLFGIGGTDIRFHVHRLDTERYWLICTLPSGRHIAYYRPKLRLGEKWGRPCEILSYRTEWAGKTFREDTYGGKMVENIVQAVARDVCAVGALNVEDAGYPVVGLVHDEVVTLPDEGFGSPEHVVELMCTLPAWITDCPVTAEGGEMQRYGK